ncbi:hypothetical protein [Mycolicibacterium brumae]|uniref:Uncharacterized protein n=1 Tax=Mycolicibacterium brumae TaxID=85968 RepID=A0A2G5PGG6_9MYCO|nr:hypothetical protein [Mycolicibacterium brumae]MCV7192606.1 hypothetical protein [Mycolicibacterium brumae]PIB77409.1 hypothetical protein CQY22_000035 [Mycolicibacterium brumae]RWA18402.1 hypothetical protein MBRU_04090 [Mycolicibacterium brumae DSM 44177]UWW10376.1 hypothetical protein L2Z93_003505 [Mycolicibacterium brumae]
MTAQPARTYNQAHRSRPDTGGRRISIYWTWSYPWEAQRDPGLLENRFSTITEVRNAVWPAYETAEFSADNFLQGVAGTLELFHRSTLSFQDVVQSVTGHPVAVFQRVDQAGYRQQIDERILADTDTLMVFGLDHLPHGQQADPAEVDALRQWLRREGSALVLAPHHDVGFTDDRDQQQVEHLHHGDPLVPRRQRFSGYTRSLMAALGVPVRNTWGLRPAVLDGGTEIAPITAYPDLDGPGLLAGVPTLSFHQHLPHYELTEPPGAGLRVLARQRVDPHRPHPFTAGGNTEFNAVVWLPPAGERAGDIVVVDSTHFTTLFGGDHSLRRLWRNVAAMPGR